MAVMPLAHVSWAIADNADRPACDAFFIDVFGAETAYEMRITPETEAMGLDREERLMMVGDAMLIPIAPAGRAAGEGSPIGDMLRRSAAPDRWLGLALKVRNLPEADAWFSARGFRLHYDPGMESHYFLVSRGQALGLRLEILAHDLPGDPRRDPAWTPAKWRDGHPLGIVGLQAIGVSAPSLDEARALFAARLEWPEISARYAPEDDADCAAFWAGDVAVEALAARDSGSALATHAESIKGIWSLTFQVRDAAAAADYLRARGLDIVGDTAGRFGLRPEQAHGRRIRFTEVAPEGYPAPGSRFGSESLD
ncbi:MAG: hypothetical protein RIQ46_1199 [Pseudomonadota bacterium]|jgi:catechol 2,3-dioxygenase-like lactoylglutathione lyase family enzyme